MAGTVQEGELRRGAASRVGGALAEELGGHGQRMHGLLQLHAAHTAAVRLKAGPGVCASGGFVAC